MYKILRESSDGNSAEVEAEFSTLREVVYYLAQHEPVDYIAELVTPEGEHIGLS